MRLDNSTYEYIKEEVADLFIRYDVKCIPINGFELATKMGIVPIPYSSLSPKKLVVAQNISPDGFYMEPGDGREYIYYNDQVGYERCNMTILHEIGHAVLGHTEDTDSEIAEAEAAFFAKYAAAPPPLVHKLQPDCPEEIADTFCISFEASWHAWNYYSNWKRFHYAYGRFTAYEEKLNKLYGITA
ncbi:MAG: ImmA/IrrE family metallo-endopeptidase [Clostridia bacterium]|nr:ImmA/IrrE family metallo-endopeptidase [Clostridia bacterium]